MHAHVLNIDLIKQIQEMYTNTNCIISVYKKKFVLNIDSVSFHHSLFLMYCISFLPIQVMSFYIKKYISRAENECQIEIHIISLC